MKIPKYAFLTSIFLFLGIREATAQKSILFNSVGAYLEVPNHPALQAQTMTLEFWLKVHESTDLFGGEQTIFDKRQIGNGYNIRLAGTQFPLPIFCFYDPSLEAHANIGVDRKRWKHFAYVFTPDSTKIFINGEINLVKKSTAYDSNSNATLFIGEFHGYPGASLRFRGELDDIRIWNVARTAIQIKNTMHSALNGSEANLQLYYDFETSNNTMIIDKSKNKINASIKGLPIIQKSDAPVGFIPLQVPVGFRAYGNDRLIKLEWDRLKDATSYNIYRGEKVDFDLSNSTKIASVSGSEVSYSDQTILKEQLYFYAIRAVDQSGNEGIPSNLFPTRTSLRTDFQTGVYYYPWYLPGQNHHAWPDQYPRDFLIPKQPPLLGQYSCDNPTILKQHFNWMKDHGIDYIISSWWGKESLEDKTLKNSIVPELANQSIKFAVYFESAILGVKDGHINISSANKTYFIESFEYLANTYFNHPNYLRINNKPVVFIYLANIFSGDYIKAYQDIRSMAKMKGFDLFLIGDLNIFDPISTDFASTMDGFSPYSPYHPVFHRMPNGTFPNDIDFLGSIARAYNSRQQECKIFNKLFIPNAWPGGNLSVADTSTTIVCPRQLGSSYSHHSVFENLIKISKPFIDPIQKIIMITSWNEWHEDTQIEPTILTSPTVIDRSPSGRNYSKGYSYNGYGDIFLRVTKELLGPDNVVPNQEIPLKNNALHIYPNPTTGNMFIQSDYSYSNSKIQFYSMNGQMVKEHYIPVPIKQQSTNIDLSDIPKGPYWVRWIEGNKVVVNKILIQ